LNGVEGNCFARALFRDFIGK